jgi:thiol:disulfide interchange protein DsbA
MLNRMSGIVFNNYKVDSTPTIIVDGKYMTSPGQVGQATRPQSQVQAFQETLQVVDALVAKVQKSK